MQWKITAKIVKKHIKTVKNRPRKMSVFDGSFFVQKTGRNALKTRFFGCDRRKGKTFRAYRKIIQKVRKQKASLCKRTKRLKNDKPVIYLSTYDVNCDTS